VKSARAIRWIGLGASIGAGSLFAVPALAEQRDASAEPQARVSGVPELADLRLNAGLGVASGQTLSGGPAAALMTTFRYSYVEGGGLFEAGSELFGGHYSLVAGTLGPVWQSSRGPRLELLGVVGHSAYGGVGCNLFCDRGGASAQMPYVGARAGVSYVVRSRKRAHLELGASFAVGSDLEQKQVDYVTYGGFLDDGEPNHSSTTLGGRRSTALFTIGTNIDLGG
jgi:hypothetical protein